MADAIDLRTGWISNSSPRDIGQWPVTLAITRVRETARGGFELTFDRPIPDAWKWASNPANPAENFAYTVWAAVLGVDNLWRAAGVVQMWQGRTMGDNSLPAMFTVHDGVPGWTNWFPWLAGYMPRPGDALGLLVSAGDARNNPGVTSVRERSNVVIVRLPLNDEGDWTFELAPGPTPVPVPPGPTTGRYEDAPIVRFALLALDVTNDVGRIGVNCARVEHDANMGEDDGPRAHVPLGYAAASAKHLAALKRGE